MGNGHTMMRTRAALLTAIVVGLARIGAAQTGGPVTVKAIDSSTGATTDVGDNTNHALRASVITMPSVTIGSLPNVTIGAALPAGGNTIGAVNLAQYTPSSGRLPVDGSGVTQPVSGTVTANAGTNLNTSALALDATLTGRLPAGASPANGESNTSTSLSRVGGYNFIFNGSTWDRWTGAVTISGTPTVSISGTPTVTANAGTGTFTVGQATGTNLHVVCDSGCTNASGFADNAAFTFGTTSINPIGGVLDDVATNVATENSAAIARITAQKALHVNFRNNSGTEIGTAATPIQVSLANTAANATAVKVDGSAVTQPVSGTVTANIGTTNGLLLDATYTGRMPAGASPASAESNTNTALSRIGSYGFIYNGSTWDRWTGAVTGTVTANIGTTNGLALDTSVNGLLLSQASTTSGQKGALSLAAVTTGNPTYTTAQTSPLSLDTAGGLRVHMISSDVSASGGTSLADRAAFTYGTTAFTPVGGVYNTSVTALTSGQAGALALDAFRTAHVGLYDVAGNVITPATDAVDNTAVPGSGPQMFGYASAATPTAAGADGRAKSIWLDTVGRTHMICDSGCSGTTLGQATRAYSLPVTMALDQGPMQVNNWLLNGWPIATGVGASTVSTQRVALSRDSSVVVMPGAVPLTTAPRGVANAVGPVYVENQIAPFSFDLSGNLRVSGGSTTYTNGAVQASPIGAVALGYDGTNVRALKTDNTGQLTISNASFNVGNFPAELLDATYTGRTPAGASPATGESNTNTALSRVGTYNFVFNGTTWDRWTGAVSVSNFPATQNVSITGTNTPDVTDRAARLLGVVYGSQGQQLQQTASNFNEKVELFTGATAYDARTIRALTSSDVVTVNNSFLLDATFTGRINTLGQKTAANSTPVVLASDQTLIPVNNTQLNSVALGSPSNYGTSPGAVAVAGVNAFITNSPTIVQGNAGSNAQAWWTQIGDTTNGPVAVKAASTPAGATDKALVVAVSPNNTVAVTSAQPDNTSLGNVFSAGALYNDLGSLAAVTSGNVAAPRMSGNRVLYTQQTDKYGTPDVTNQMILNQLVALTAVDAARVGLSTSAALGGSVNSAFALRLAALASTPAPDPCDGALKGNVGISQTASTQLLQGMSSKRVFICSAFVNPSDAEQVSLVEGTGTTCATGTGSIIGSTTAANGTNLAASGGFTLGNGRGTVATTTGYGTNVCLLQSGAGRVAGNITYVYQ